MASGESGNERASLRSARGDPADSYRRCSAAGAPAGLSHHLAAERGGELPHYARRAVAVRRRTARAGAISPDRRPQHRLHCAEHFRRLHDESLQRRLHRA